MSRIFWTKKRGIGFHLFFFELKFNALNFILFLILLPYPD